LNLNSGIQKYLKQIHHPSAFTLVVTIIVQYPLLFCILPCVPFAKYMYYILTVHVNKYILYVLHVLFFFFFIFSFLLVVPRTLPSIMYPELCQVVCTQNLVKQYVPRTLPSNTYTTPSNNCTTASNNCTILMMYLVFISIISQLNLILVTSPIAPATRNSPSLVNRLKHGIGADQDFFYVISLVQKKYTYMIWTSFIN